MSYRYAIQCQTMPKLEQHVVKDQYELMRLIEQYVLRFGPIDILYCVGRA